MALTISDYEFKTLLGKGTFGSVYLVRRRKDGKPFALKKQVFEEHTVSLKIALEEVQCMQTMRHPNIVSYHGAWIENKQSYILMEYATRCTLKDLLENRDAPMKEDDAYYLFSQVVLGVHHIHSKNILHRDLKPENILLTGSRGDIVKIGDFGVSKNLQGLRHQTKMCRAGSFYYMAPEMLLGESYDFKSDIWSMGVILYEMITKRVPFPAKSVKEIITMTSKESPRPLSCNPSVPIVTLISKMLKKRSVHRPSTKQLMFCPYLVPSIILIHLNLGRTEKTVAGPEGSLNSNVFMKFFKA